MNLTMKDLEQCFRDARFMNSMFIGVKIQMQGFPECEVIINPSENFDTKLAYYKKAYNDTLTLKTFNGIKIINFGFGDCYDELECQFENIEE